MSITGNEICSTLRDYQLGSESVDACRTELMKCYQMCTEDSECTLDCQNQNRRFRAKKMKKTLFDDEYI